MAYIRHLGVSRAGRRRYGRATRTRTRFRNRNAAYKRRKRTGYRRKRSRRSTRVPRLYARSLGAPKTVTLRYVDRTGLILAPVFDPTYGSKSYRLASPYDPLFQIGGQSAALYSDFSRQYLYYEVKYVKATFWFYRAQDTTAADEDFPPLVGLQIDPQGVRTFNSGEAVDNAKQQEPFRFIERTVTNTVNNGARRFVKMVWKGTPSQAVGKMNPALQSSGTRPNFMSAVTDVPNIDPCITPFSRLPIDNVSSATEAIHYSVQIDYVTQFHYSASYHVSNTTSSLTDDWAAPADVANPGANRDV